MEVTRKELIKDFLLLQANKNIPYQQISGLLKKKFGVELSCNAIGKRLKSLGYRSRRGITCHSRQDIENEIRRLLPSLSRTVGYRHMTIILRQNGYNVRRDLVMTLMRELDPDGVSWRRKRRILRKVYRSLGPNHIWHIDGYDKLKPYGFPIHGCIDGFSRKILWLTVGPSNNNPAIVATNYVSCIEELKGCPLILQADPGTENSVCGAIQCVLRHNSYDFFAGEKSYQIVRSVFNQRIEAWWSILRRHSSDWWINFFKDLESLGDFHKGNLFEMHCIRYCFMPVLQNELDSLKDAWNHHHITHSRQATCPNGRPEVLYSLCEEYGGKECIQTCSGDDIEWAISECQLPSRSGSVEFDAFASHEFSANGWQDTTDRDEALEHYRQLKRAQF